MLKRLKPAFGVDRLALIAQFKIQASRPAPTAGATGGNNFICIDPIADVLEQAFIVAVQAQVPIAMIYDDQQPETT